MYCILHFFIFIFRARNCFVGSLSIAEYSTVPGAFSLFNMFSDKCFEGSKHKHTCGEVSSRFRLVRFASDRCAYTVSHFQFNSISQTQYFLLLYGKYSNSKSNRDDVTVRLRCF
jgi:hypothetical protein